MKSLRAKKSAFTTLNIESIKISNAQLDKVRGGNAVRRGDDEDGDGRRGG